MRMLVGLGLALVLGVVFVPAAEATHGPNVFSGQWTTNTGGVGFRVVTSAEGASALRSQGGTPCPSPTVYYRGGYYDPASGASGKVTGCTEGSHTHLVARYVGDPATDPGAAGEFDVNFVPPNRFDGSYTADSTKTKANPNGSPAPYTATFKAHFPGDGCCLESKGLTVDYAVPDRFGPRGSNGLVEYRTHAVDLEPRYWGARLTVKPCAPNTGYVWKIDGHRYIEHGCSIEYRFPKLGRYPVKVSEQLHPGVAGSRDVLIRDWLIVGIGDSMGSGEGVPDVEIGKGQPRARWEDRRCHRSAFSFEANVARAVEEHDKQTSVSFVHLACSGASITSGLLGGYEGIEPPRRGGLLAPQIEAMRSITEGRKIDALVVSIGVNDLHFGAVIKFCLFNGDCRDRKVIYDDKAAKFKNDSAGVPLRDLISSWIARLPNLYGKLNSALHGIVPPNRVYLAEYPDSTRNSDGKTFCDDLARINYFLRIRAADSQWLGEGFAAGLNAAGAQAARDLGWHYAAGAQDSFRTHGYCAGTNRLIVTYQDSNERQGDNNGTLHPNRAGHLVIGGLAAKKVLADLYPNGHARP
jgi:hypothetical protein